ncbi:MAG TPA: hypothetical protein VN726_23500 [Hanamia sp.]|nr:hypothetical protein [Hanamia sp.]
MKKLILAIGIVVFSTAAAQAQDASKSTTLSIAANVGIPTTTGLSLAYGGDLQADFGVAPTTKITASAGYEAYSVKGGGSSSGIIPLLGGVKFNLGDKAYAHGQLGYGVSTAKGGSGSFAYAPSLGYYVSRNFDASVKYLAFSNHGTLGSVNLRLAYNF